MLTLIVGSYPRLEAKLAERLRALGSPRRPPPVAVLAPSRRLLAHLQRTVARDHGLALANVWFETFQSFARRLLIEEGVPAAAFTESPAVEERLVERALDRLPAGHPLRALAGTPGLLASLLGTIRDLDEARVTADALDAPELEAVRGGGGLGVIQPLLAVLEAERVRLRLFNQAAIVARATEAAPASAWLSAFAHVFHYGAYDLTQHQFDWLYALGQAVETTVLFPGVGEREGRLHPAYRFAEPSLSLIRRKASSETWLEGPRAPRGSPLVIEAGDPAEEFDLIAEEIRRLVDGGGFRTSDIVVVARSLDGALGHAAGAFARAGVPWETPASTPLVELPAGRGLIALAGALAGEPAPSTVVDLLVQDWLDVWTPERPSLRRAQAIARRLPPFARGPDWVAVAEAGDPGRDAADIYAARSIARGVERLEREANRFPPQASWSAFVDAWVAAYEALVREPGEHASVLAEGIAAVEELSRLDAVESVVPAPVFHARVRRALDRAGIRLRDRRGGVRVLSAMDARGIRPRVLFVAGANDGVFPRIAHEDPFLRDDARRALNDPIGFKIQTKRADGGAEERLLFGLLADAPVDRLYLSWHAEDGKGHRVPVSPLVPQPADGRRLAAELRAAARASALAAANPDAAAVSLRVVRELKAPPSGGLGPRDGPPAAGRRPARLRVTQLRDLAKCPFRVHLNAALRIDAPRGPRSWWEAEAWRIGMVLHGVLDAALPGLLAGTYPSAKAAARAEMPAVLARSFAPLARLPVLTAAFDRELGGLAALTLDAEREFLSANGLVPEEYEQRSERAFGTTGLELSFQADRMDRAGTRAHVTDYKSHTGRTSPAKSPKLDPETLQVSLYLHLLAPGADPAFSVVHLGPAMRPQLQPVRAEGVEARELVARALVLAEAMARGWLTGPAVPWPDGILGRNGDWEPDCQWCEFRAVCRRDHAPTRARLEAAAEVAALREVLP